MTARRTTAACGATSRRVATPRICVRPGPADASANVRRKVVSRLASNPRRCLARRRCQQRSAPLRMICGSASGLRGLLRTTAYSASHARALIGATRSKFVELCRVGTAFFLRLWGQGRRTGIESHRDSFTLRARRARVNGTKTFWWHETQHRRFGRIVTELMPLRNQRLLERFVASVCETPCLAVYRTCGVQHANLSNPIG